MSLLALLFARFRAVVASLVFLCIFTAFVGCSAPPDLAPRPDANDLDVAPTPDAAPPITSDASVDVAPDTPSPPDATPPADAESPPADVVPSMCTESVVRAVALPGDRLTGRPAESDPRIAAFSGCRGWSGYGPAVLRTEARSHVYALRIDRRRGIELRASEGGWFVSVRRRCDDTASTVLCDLLGAQLRVVLDPGEYFVVITSGRSDVSASYDLAVSAFEPDANAWCESAATLAPGVSARAENIPGGAGLASVGCSTLGHPQRYFAVTVPARHRAIVEVTSFHQTNPVPAWSPWRPLLRAFADCNPAECLGRATMMLYLDNHRDTPKRVIVSVGSAEHPVYGTGNADLAVRFVPVVEAPIAAACSAASRIGDGSVRRQDGSLGPEVIACGGGSLLHMFYYTAVVPAGATLLASFASTTRMPGAPLAVHFMESCGARSCPSSAYGSGRSDLRQWTNTAAETRQVVMAVGVPSETPAPTFDLRVAVRAPPTNVACADAITLREGEGRTMELAGQGGSGPRCWPSRARGVYYRIVVPARRRLTVSATPAGDFDSLGLVLTRDCADATCLARLDGSPTREPARITWANTSAEDTTLLVFVSSTGVVADLAISLAALTDF